MAVHAVGKYGWWDPEITAAESAPSFRSISSVASFSENDGGGGGGNGPGDEDEIQLRWATIERLPTFRRMRSALLDIEAGDGGDGRRTEGKRIVDVGKLNPIEQRAFIENLTKNVEEDNRRLLEKLKERLKKVDVRLPTIEVRFQNLCVEARCQVVHGRPLPTLWNSRKRTMKGFMRTLGWRTQEVKRSILKDMSGIIKPSRMTLLLGPPASGKTTLLLALAGKLNQTLKRIPIWWIWLYWICPMSWSTNAFLTSQYGDITEEIVAFGNSKTINDFVQEYYGFHHNQLGLVAIVLVSFPILFASLFAICIAKKKFHRR